MGYKFDSVHFFFFFFSSIFTARKTKKKIKGIQQATTGVSQDTSENPNKTIVPAALPQLTPTLVSLLEVIEPEVLYSGYDSSIPDSTWRIMTTLNMLGGRQVIAAVKWAKAIPGKIQMMTELQHRPLYFLEQKHSGLGLMDNSVVCHLLTTRKTLGLICSTPKNKAASGAP